MLITTRNRLCLKPFWVVKMRWALLLSALFSLQLNALAAGAGNYHEAGINNKYLAVNNLAEETGVADIRVTGLVSAENTGLALAGATVTLKGSSKGTVTDANGYFTMDIPSPGGILVISYVGYEPFEITVSKDTDLKISLKVRESKTEEVVVVGFGVKKRANLTGSVSSVKMDEVLGSRSVSSTSKALQGALPGLQITYGTGLPGAAASLNVRGLTSLSPTGAPLTGSPLVLVDNVPVNIDDINPADIESVSLLKDASASSIYGARAAFGVLLITTKKGVRNQAPKFEYTTNFSFTEASTLPEKPTPSQYVQALKDFGTVTYWGGQDVQKWATFISDYEKNPSAYYRDRIKDNGLIYPLAQQDLHKQLFPGGKEQLHNLSFSGGSDKTNYRISAGYTNEDGIMVAEKDTYKRYNFNANINTAITSWLSASVGTMYKNDKRLTPTNQGTLYYNAITLPSPIEHGYDTASTGEYLPYSTPENLVRLEEPTTTTSDNIRLFGKMEITPVTGLKITGEYTFSKTNSNNTLFVNVNRYISPIKFDVSQLTGSSSYYRDNSQSNYQAVNLYANYEKKINDHSFSLLVGMNNEKSRQSDFYVQRLDVLTPQVPSISTSSGTITGDDNFNEFGVLGYFGRFNYNYKNRYLLEVNGRYDGSSRFPSTNRWGFFPSFSAGWNVREEKFASSIRNVFQQIKLRASWGEIGNQAIGNYDFIPGLSAGNSGWINPATGIPFLTLSAPALVRNNFTWETVRTLNLGIDLAVLRNRLNTSFDWFNRKTLDLLAPGAQLPAVLGAPAPLQNVADIESKGWEFEISWKDKIKKFSYSFAVNISDNQGYITKYQNAVGLISQPFKGQRLGDIWGYTTQGYYTVDDFVTGALNSSLINTSASTGLVAGVAPFQGIKQNPGDIRYADLNGDSVINAGNNTLSNPGDMRIIGNSNRRYQFGFIANFAYSNFDLSFFGQGVGKRDLWISNQVIFPYQGQFGGIFKHQLDYWMPNKTNAWIPRVYKDGAGNSGSSQRVQTKYLSNGAYLRVKNISFGYTIPDYLTRKVQVNKVRVFFAGENLITLNHLPTGLDPESADVNVGGIYPFIRKFSFGINISF
jgi:TonB-linked SusC/RagA family outer membrane protein